MKHLSDFGIWLIKILEEKGYKKVEFANDVGISRRILYYYITGRSRPSPENLEIIKCVLETKVLVKPKRIGHRGKARKNL